VLPPLNVPHFSVLKTRQLTANFGSVKELLVAEKKLQQQNKKPKA